MASRVQLSQGQSITAEGRCVRLLAKADDPASIAPSIERRALSRATNEVLIEVKAAAVNPSDVKAATGLMPYAVFPRTPGRDYAGVVIDGPEGWTGREVFGSSGDLGIRRDGTHANYLAVEAEALVEKPKNISWKRPPASACPSSRRWRVFAVRVCPGPARRCWLMGINGEGRSGRDADRDLARRPRDRRGAQERAL